MEGNLSKFKADLDKLLKTSDQLHNDIWKLTEGKKAQKGEMEPGLLFRSLYQRWYSESQAVIQQILPSRLNEFETLYKGDGKRKFISAVTYSIQDWLLGIEAGKDDIYSRKYFDDVAAMSMRFFTQTKILESANLRFESSLLDIRQILQADLFDTEIESAKELLNKGFLRASGAVAGVVAEKHLAQVCINHKIEVNIKNPTINSYNVILKKEDAIEAQEYLFIQRLGDLRNLCDHNKEREPTKDEVNELIEKVEKLIKTIF